jgi:copper chaperone CopZ
MLELSAPGIKCMFCVYRLKAAIRKIDPRLKISIDPHAGRIGVARPEDLVKVERALAGLSELARS